MSHEPEQLDGGERELEAALSRLRPAAVGIDRDRLLYEAGRRAGRRQAGPWRWTAAAAGVAASVLAAMLAIRPAAEVRTVERIVEVPTPAPAWETPAVSPAPPGPLVAATPAEPEDEAARAAAAQNAERMRRYLALRDRVLTAGVDALREIAPAQSPSPSPGQAQSPSAPPPLSRWMSPAARDRLRLPAWMTGDLP